MTAKYTDTCNSFQAVAATGVVTAMVATGDVASVHEEDGVPGEHAQLAGVSNARSAFCVVHGKTEGSISFCS